MTENKNLFRDLTFFKDCGIWLKKKSVFAGFSASGADPKVREFILCVLWSDN